MAVTTKVPPLVQEVTESISVDVFNMDGDELGRAIVDPAELGAKINRQLLHEVVLMHLANRRRGTHSTKRRGEVAGSKRKLFRQKGTGNARVGTRRTNKRRGGGTAKGPKPRDYSYYLPKKAVRAARKMALLSKLYDSEAKIIDRIELEEISTAEMADILDALGLYRTSLLICLAEPDIDERRTIYLSARNIPQVEVLPAAEVNTYALLRPKVVLLSKAATEELIPNVQWEISDSPVTRTEESASGEKEQDAESEDASDAESEAEED